MRTCTPSEFLARWPGSLRPVELPEPGPALPEDCRRLLTRFGLPRWLTIRCYNDVTLRFGGRPTPLSAIWARDLEGGRKLQVAGHRPGEMPVGWGRYWHLGDQEYTQGGGWVCIEEGTGRFVVIDLDLPEPVYLLNSGVATFYTTLAHLLDWSERTGGGPAETALLRDALRSQRCVSPYELEPFWLNVVDATLGGDPVDLAVELGAT